MAGESFSIYSWNENVAVVVLERSWENQHALEYAFGLNAKRFKVGSVFNSESLFIQNQHPVGPASNPAIK